jgi:hypothetical protein
MSQNETIYELHSHSRTISFITTHPNVSISLFKFERERNTNLEVFRNHNIKEKTRKTRQYDNNKPFQILSLTIRFGIPQTKIRDGLSILEMD